MEDRDAAEKEWEFERTELQKKYEVTLALSRTSFMALD